MDCYPGSLRIPVSYYEGEIKAALDDYDVASSVSVFRGCAVVEGEMLINGEFRKLEEWLVDHEVPFDRYSSGYFEIMPCVRRYRPAQSDCGAIDARGPTLDGIGLVPADEIHKCLTLSPEEAFRKLHALADEYCPLLPSLESYNKNNS